MKQLFLYCLLLPLLFTAACKEDKLDPFEPEESGSSIYFKDKFLAATEDNGVALFKRRSISFGYTDLAIRDSILKLPVTFTGVAAAADRAYVVAVDPSSTLKEGTHFEFVSKTPVIRAGKYTDTLAIKLLRTVDLQQDTGSLNLLLKANEHFNIRMPFRKHTNGRDSLSIISYDLDIDDITGMPAAWNDLFLKTIMNGYFGEYSRAKLLLLLKVLEFDVAILTKLPTAMSDKYKIADKVAVWSRYMVFWLGVEKQAGRIYKDENGKEITMGPFAG